MKQIRLLEITNNKILDHQKEVIYPKKSKNLRVDKIFPKNLRLKHYSSKYILDHCFENPSFFRGIFLNNYDVIIINLDLPEELPKNFNENDIPKEVLTNSLNILHILQSIRGLKSKIVIYQNSESYTEIYPFVNNLRGSLQAYSEFFKSKEILPCVYVDDFKDYLNYINELKIS